MILIIVFSNIIEYRQMSFKLCDFYKNIYEHLWPLIIVLTIAFILYLIGTIAFILT